MVSFTALSLLSIAAGSVAAHPAKHTVWETVIETKYVTIPYGAHAPAPQTSVVVSEQSAYKPKPKPKHSSSSAPAYAPAPVVTYAPAPKPTTSSPPPPPPSSSKPVAPPPAPSSSSVPPPPPPSSTKAAEQPKPTQESGSSGPAYMDVVNEWRGKMGMKNLQHDDLLQSNAAKCATAGNGQMVHKLFEGTYGQVLAPGTPDNFKSVFVGGWLCEDRTLPGLGDAVCDEMEKGWDHSNNDKGHAEILSSPQYSKIGCAFVNGIWDCDLA